jgi:hypothetical protein
VEGGEIVVCCVLCVLVVTVLVVGTAQHTPHRFTPLSHADTSTPTAPQRKHPHTTHPQPHPQRPPHAVLDGRGQPGVRGVRGAGGAL